MAQSGPRYERGWQRFGFGTMDFVPQRVHEGGNDIMASVGFDRGAGMPFVAHVVVEPGGESPALGLHVHRSAELGRDVEEWYVIIEGTGIQWFSNGDSVEFGPGDLIAVYPGTAHSLEVTGDQPVKMLGIMPECYMTVAPDHPVWPETWEPRIKILTTSPELNPTSAECTDCGATWERPEGDRGSNTLPAWAGDHGCTGTATTVHLRADERE
jgi:mannose-6-phosphate isomerase-like protein (cupin superfamily)